MTINEKVKLGFEFKVSNLNWRAIWFVKGMNFQSSNF
jgi:hypothetical protein